VYGQSVQDQAPLSWIQRHKVSVPYEAVRSYENIFWWIAPEQSFILHSGHLGLPVQTEDWSEPCQTNQIWHYDFTSNVFSPTTPWLRPPKRCGGKGIYDEAFNRIIIHGGGHRLDMGYGYINPDGNALTTDEDERNLWVYDPSARQWYDMRPVYKELMTQTDRYWRGYSFNVGYAREYGLMLFNACMGRFIQAYSLHDNRWSYFGKSGTITRGSNRSASYDLRHHALVIAGGGTDTWVFQLGTNTWSQKAYTQTPTSASTWYGGYDAVSYDENAGRHVFLKGDGSAMYTLDLADSAGWKPLTASAYPPSSGHLGQQFHYSRELNIHYLYASVGSEVWTFRLSGRDTAMPGPPVNVRSHTTASGIHIAWDRPDLGPVPDQYYIYKTNWVRVLMSGLNIGHEPGPYVKTDSTTSLEIDLPVTYSPDEWYSFYVSAVSSGLESTPSTPAFTTPAVPMALVASVYSNTRVALKWKPHPGSDITGYNVYRAMGETPYRSGFTKLNAAPVTLHRYTDTAATLSAGLIGNYAVTAVNVLGYESGFSPVAFTVPDPVPGVYMDTVSMTLNWSPSPCDTILGYQPVRAARSGDYWNYFTGGWNYFGAITQDTFVTVDNPGQYVYGVRAVNVRNQRGSFSDFAPYPDRHAVNMGWFLGDGRFNKPVADTFWQDLGQGSIGIEEEEGTIRSGSVSVETYPNPFNPTITIRIQCKLQNANCKMQIFNAAGRMVHQVKNPASGEYQWKTAGLPSGIYFVRVQAGKARVTRKIVLQR
jgi:hypothetical protein